MKAILVLASVFFIMGCGGDGNSSATKPSVFFNKVTEAVSSASGLVGGTSSLATPTCVSGAPTSSSPGQAQYPGEQVFCALNTNSMSPDTVQGSYFLASKILCAIEKTVSFTYGTLPTATNGVSISETDDCFGASGFDLNDDGSIGGSFVISFADAALPEGSAFDFYIGIQFSPTYAELGADLVQFYLKDSGGILAARLYQPTFGSIFDLSIDSNEGTFSYENKDFGNERHIRFWADGDLNTEGAFTAVTAAKFIYSQGDSGSSNTVSIMNYLSGSEQYDHFLNTVRQPGFSIITTLPHDLDFYTWTGRSILDADLISAGPVSYNSSFTMSFK